MKLKEQMKKNFIAASFLFGCIVSSNANNVAITGSSVLGSNITFNISWENSWNVSTAPNNWDAVWVVVKFQDCATREWVHANLSTANADHSAGSPLQVDAVSDGKGVFIRRAANGGGNISNISVTLKMNIAAGTYNYKVVGIEMVNIPAGSFYVGDGSNLSNTFAVSSSVWTPKLISSTEQSGGVSIYQVGVSTITIASTYPMGVNSLYCMKYEITQQQYVDFLNSLTLAQQVNRTANDPASIAGTYALVTSGANRNGLAIMTPTNGVNPAVYGSNLNSGNAFNSADDGQNIACNYLKLDDIAAYLDWSALRPMTEFEFEKVCRGPLTPIAGEFPWGNATITAVNSANLINSGTASEGFSNTATGLCNYSSAMTGPVRSGYAATGASARSTAGATYYGVLDMGGNLAELTIGYPSTVFNGVLGDGTLDLNGIANTLNWPLGTSVNLCPRGGSWSASSQATALSFRANTFANGTTAYQTRIAGSGGRGVR